MNLSNKQFDNLILNESEATRFISELVNDYGISDDEFERKYQHIRDDVAYYANKYNEVDLDKIANFHGSVVYDLYKKYLGDD